MNNRQIGTGFINLDKLLRANQGNRLGQTANRYIQNAGSRASEDIKQGQQNFQTDANKNRLDTDVNKQFVTNTINQTARGTSQQTAPTNVQQPQNQTPVVQQASQQNTATQNQQTTPQQSYGQPVKATGSVQPPVQQNTQTQPVVQQNVQTQPTQPYIPTAGEQGRFQQIIQGQYQGPTDIKDIQNITANAQNAQDIGNLSKDYAGQKLLLQNMFGGQNYGMGARSLDAALLGQQSNELAKARQSTQGLTEQARAAQEGAKTYADFLSGKAQEFGQQTLKDVGQAKTQQSDILNQTVRGKMNEEQERKNLFDQLQKDLTFTPPKEGEKISPENDPMAKATNTIKLMQNKGIITADDATKLLGDSNTPGLLSRSNAANMPFLEALQKRITQTGAQNVSREGLVNDQQAAQLNALDRLAGKTGQQEFGEGARNAYKEGSTKFDLGDFQSAVETAEKNNQSTPGFNVPAAPGIQKPGKSGLIGGLLGTALGSYFGPVGAMLGGKLGAMVGPAAGKAIHSIGKGIGKIFCFTGDTDIMMENGSFKKLKDLKVNDKIALGGRITAIGQGLIDDIYSYKGFQVSGSHAVFENGKWIRVQDSDHSIPIGKEKETLVYPLASEKHLMVTRSKNGILVSADMEEVDDTYNITDDEIMKKLNTDTIRNKQIERFLKSNGNKKL